MCVCVHMGTYIPGAILYGYLYSRCYTIWVLIFQVLYYMGTYIPGGTDIISCFVGENHTLPVYKGEIQTRNLGYAVESWNLDGERQEEIERMREGRGSGEGSTAVGDEICISS